VTEDYLSKGVAIEGSAYKQKKSIKKENIPVVGVVSLRSKKKWFQIQKGKGKIGLWGGEEGGW